MRCFCREIGCAARSTARLSTSSEFFEPFIGMWTRVRLITGEDRERWASRRSTASPSSSPSASSSATSSLRRQSASPTHPSRQRRGAEPTLLPEAPAANEVLKDVDDHEVQRSTGPLAHYQHLLLQQGDLPPRAPLQRVRCGAAQTFLIP